MSYSMYLSLTLATIGNGRTPSASDVVEPTLEESLRPLRAQIESLVERCRGGAPTPLATAQFETNLQQLLRELGRVIVEWTYNHLEPGDIAALPPQVECEGNAFRRLAKKPPQAADTLFGAIRLQRLGYRSAPSVGEPVLFPLCQELGIIHGTTPALCERVA